MIDGKTVLGVIPARGGSKRFPRKNVAPFRGLPLLVWSIVQAEQSNYLDTLVCSTDDDEIELMALIHGCKALKRPANLATDEATNEDVLRHALFLYPADYIVLLQPTSPLRLTQDIDSAINMFHVEHRPVVSYRPDGTKNGAVYVASAQWLENHTFADDHIRYWMPIERSLDIDYPEDVSLSCHC